MVSHPTRRRTRALHLQALTHYMLPMRRSTRLASCLYCLSFPFVHMCRWASSAGWGEQGTQQSLQIEAWKQITLVVTPMLVGFALAMCLDALLCRLAKVATDPAAELLSDEPHASALPQPPVTDPQQGTPQASQLVRMGQLELLQTIQQRGSLDQFSEADNLHLVHVAAACGQLETMAWLYAQSSGPPIDVVDANGMSSMHYACARGHLRVAIWLHKHGALLDSENNLRQRPLHLACAASLDWSVVEWLLGNGVGVETADSSGFRPLHIAARSGNLVSLSMLLDKGAKINVTALDGTQPLHQACTGGWIPCAERLVQARAGLDVRAHNGLSPIHFAAFHGHSELTQWLCDHGALINTPELPAVRFIELLNDQHEYDSAEVILQACTDQVELAKLDGVLGRIDTGMGSIAVEEPT